MSPQTNPQGVPKELLEAKKLELIQEKVNDPKVVLSAADDARLTPKRQQKKPRIAKIKNKLVSGT